MVQGIASIDAQQPQQGQMPPDAQAALGQGFSNLSQEEISHLRQLSDSLKQLSPDKLQVLEQVIQFLKKNAGQYAKAVQVLVTKGIVQPGDLPPQYIPSFFEILDTMVRQAMAGGEKQGFARGGIAQLRKKASDVAKAGTGGDKVLAHINPREAAMLQATRGGGMNPSTGLPEYGFFDDIGNFFKQAAPVVLPVALNFLVPGLGTIASGAIGAGVGALINGASPGDALKSAALGGAAGAVFSGIQNMGQEGGFMGGVQKGLPSSMQPAPSYTPAPASASNPTVPGASTMGADKGMTSNPYYNGGGGGSQFNAGASAPATASAGGGFFDKVGNWISTNPWPAVGLAGLGAGAIGYAMNTKDESAPPMMSSQGATPQQIAAARFAPGSFTQRTAPQINVTPTYSTAYPTGYVNRGVLSVAQGGQIDARIGGHLEGPGTGTSDSIPAKLSDGEFVMTARAVRGAGGGDRSAGAKKMYALMHQFEKRA